jgi:hypothetical protein
MPKFLETKLKKEYGAGSAIPFKVMNTIGAMHGNKETPKGAAMEAKHEAAHGILDGDEKATRHAASASKARAFIAAYGKKRTGSGGAKCA